jgi:hypothetical protein
MVLGARQRREVEELEDIDREFALDGVDIVQDRVDGVVGEAEDIAGIGDDARRFPGLQHLTVFGDLVLPLLGAEQVVGIDVL